MQMGLICQINEEVAWFGAWRNRRGDKLCISSSSAWKSTFFTRLKQNAASNSFTESRSLLLETDIPLEIRKFPKS